MYFLQCLGLYLLPFVHCKPNVDAVPTLLLKQGLWMFMCGGKKIQQNTPKGGRVLCHPLTKSGLQQKHCLEPLTVSLLLDFL